LVPGADPSRLISDWESLEKDRNGDERAWRRLFERHTPPLLRMAALMTGSTDAAQDIVQETFLRLLNGSRDYYKGSFRGFLSTIVYRLSLKENISRQRRKPFSEIEPRSPDPSPLELAVSDERQREVAGVLRSLPEHHRDVLILRLYGDRSYEEIAEMTGVSIGTVKSRIFYAVKAIRKELKKRGVL
jgi:RNA polymerase sigma-70 factor (ECF subfamily)